MLSSAEVSRLLGLREARVRELVRGGLCGTPGRGRRYAFSFQDLVVLRAAKELLDGNVPAARVRRALAALRAELPEGRPLSGLRIFADGREVAVRDGGAAWQPATGQIVLDFGLDDLARDAAHVPRPAAAAPDQPAESRERHADGAEAAPEPRDDADVSARARAAFERALELEDVDPEAARDAYQHAIALDPRLVDARVNLGRIVHEAGDAPEAVRLYEEALARSPDDPIVHFNLALALEDAEQPDAAADHYRSALALDPDFADAHYNLAGLYELAGRKAEALRHYHAYKKLTDG
jgi:tetratricopeptide (TPR) repeat protein